LVELELLPLPILIAVSGPLTGYIGFLSLFRALRHSPARVQALEQPRMRVRISLAAGAVFAAGLLVVAGALWVLGGASVPVRKVLVYFLPAVCLHAAGIYGGSGLACRLGNPDR
jgi:hypothetical protein